ncbi:MAG: S-layer homology domain-containing protein [Clostridia bacterium]|nr:S-layer homology domain-containing protein [Clostridia bacterium]
MKRIFSALLVICLIFSLLICVPTQIFAANVSSSSNIFYAKYLGEIDGVKYDGDTPVIDGIINADEWFESDFKPWPKAVENDICFYYDEENIYIAVRIQNEKVEVPYFPLRWQNAMDKFILWLDPYDEGAYPDRTSSSYFMEFHTQYASVNSNGAYGTELYTDDSNCIGTQVSQLLPYYDVECKANTDDAFNNMRVEIYPETLGEHITFENDKPWGLDVPNGIWTFEYKIPFGLLSIFSIEDEITLTDSNDWGTYIAFSGLFMETKNSTLENVKNMTGHSDTINAISTYILERYDYTACYFSEVRPGQIFDEPDVEIKNDSSGIPDVNFYNAVREILELEDDQPLTEADVESLRYLDVSNCQIEDLTGIELFKNISCLVATDNNIASVDGIKFPCGSIDLRNNSLTSFDGENINHTNVEIDLTNNKISTVKNINSKYGHIALGENCITDLEDMENIYVRGIDLSLNGLTDFYSVVEYFEENSNLEYLSVSFNPFDNDISYINSIRKSLDEKYGYRHLAMAGIFEDKDDYRTYTLSNYVGDLNRDYYRINGRQYDDITDLKFLTDGEYTFEFGTSRVDEEFLPYLRFYHTLDLEVTQEPYDEPTGEPSDEEPSQEPSEEIITVLGSENINEGFAYENELYFDLSGGATVELEIGIDGTTLEFFADPDMTIKIDGEINMSEQIIVIYGKKGDETYFITLSKPATEYFFADLEEGAWYLPYVDIATSLGIVNGVPYDNYTVLKPEDKATRIEGIIFALRMLGVESKAFADVELSFEDYDEKAGKNYWSVNYVKAAVSLGLMKGSEVDGKLYLNGNNPISRQEFFAIFSRAMQTFDKSEDYKETDLSKFYDEDGIAPWFVDNIKYLVHNRIVEGNPSIGGGYYINPEGDILRCEIIKMVTVALT